LLILPREGGRRSLSRQKKKETFQQGRRKDASYIGTESTRIGRKGTPIGKREGKKERKK